MLVTEKIDLLGVHPDVGCLRGWLMWDAYEHGIIAWQ